MKIKFQNHYALSTILFATFISVAQANDKDESYNHGQQLVEENCTQCHSDEVYKRKDHFVKSLSQLGTQVRRCKDNSGLSWFDEDTDAVIHFLNTKYYKF